MGSPKNKLLLRLMENPEWRKQLDKVETEMNSDLNKDELYHLKEALYFVIDERQHQADLTEIGRTHLRPENPDAFMLPDLATEFSDLDKDSSISAGESARSCKLAAQQRYATISEEIHSISQLLRAYSLYERDVAYVVQEGKVMIVDENTGRVMPGRRWSDGLHQAVEAKEGVTIERETRTYATITIQNYFRMYEKLAGMTGTAETEATEFNDIYRLVGPGDPDQQAVHPGRQERLDLQGAPRQVQRRHARDRGGATRGASPSSWARRASRPPRSSRGCSGARGSSTPSSTPSSTSRRPRS